MSKNVRTGIRWSKKQDSTLKTFLLSNGEDSPDIFARAGTCLRRSESECRNRWCHVIKPGLVKGPWTQEEDLLILECINSGIKKWSDVARRVKGRIGKQCRERWANHLDPGLKKTEWTLDEDNLLTRLQAEFGNCWTKIAIEMPGRGDNEVKNRWYSADRKRKIGALTIKADRETKSTHESDKFHIELSNLYIHCYLISLSTNKIESIQIENQVYTYFL